MKKGRTALRDLFSGKARRARNAKTNEEVKKSTRAKKREEKTTSKSNPHRKFRIKGNGRKVGDDQHKAGGLFDRNEQAIYYPKHKKLKGHQKDHKGNKVRNS
jgi:hypothetical protein